MKQEFYLLPLLAFCSPCFGSQPLLSDDQVGHLLNEFTKDLGKIDAPRVTPDASLADGTDRQKSPCEETYLRLYEKPEVDFRVVFGYADDNERPYPAYGPHDRIVKEKMVNLLTVPCWAFDRKFGANRYFACGFSRAPDDGDVLIRKVKGPDGRSKLVKLTLVHSSVSTDDVQNHGELLPQQRFQSYHAREVYLDGIRRANVVLYNGHARYGGGPDFAPAVRLSNGMIDHKPYQTRKPGLTAVLENLRKRDDGGPQLVGFYSCASKVYFSNAIKKASPHTAFIGLRKTPRSWNDTHRAVLATLNALLGQICEPAFSHALNEPMDMKNNFVLERFFSEPD